MIEFIEKKAHTPWIDGLTFTTRPFPNRPRLSPTIVAVPMGADRLAIRRSGTPGRVALIAGNVADPCLRSLDGARTASELVRDWRLEFPEESPESLSGLLAGLHEIGALEDGAVDQKLEPEDLLRYSRNLNCWSAMPSSLPSKHAVQSRLGRGCVLVIGVGGIGSHTALGLAMLGVGRTVLVDFDLVELQNLNRQVPYVTDDIGRYKVDAACERIGAVNPRVAITGRHLRIQDTEAVEHLIRENLPDIVVLAADRPFRRIDRWVSEACFRDKVAYITGGVGGNIGLVWSKVPGETGCEECDRLTLRDTSEADFEMNEERERHDLMPATAAIAFGAQIVGGLIGFDILRHLLGWPMESAGRMLEYDFFRMRMRKKTMPPHPDCVLENHGNS